MKTKRFTSCLGCPFHYGYGPYCGAPGGPRDEYHRSPRIESPSKRGARPPEWCPLRKGPITLVLDTSKESAS